MSDFATVFANLMTGGVETKEARLAQMMDLYNHTREEATIVDEVIQQAIINACCEVGKALDGLSPKLSIDAMPALLHRAKHNMAALEESVLLAIIGEEQPTPGCDCKACDTSRRLHAELTACEAAVSVGPDYSTRIN